MHDFAPIPALVGGALIGLAASLLLLTHGRVAGISGIYGGVLRPSAPDKGFRLWFLAGLVASGLLVRAAYPAALPPSATGPLGGVLVAGLLVGFGTQLGSGCTSGHGVCGISRLSLRSVVATVAFMIAGFATVYVVRHLFGGAS